MKILQIVKTFFPYTTGGIEEVVRGLSTEFIVLGHEVTLLTCTSQVKEKTLYEYEGINCIALPSLFEVFSTPFSTSLKSVFEEIVIDFDVVIYHTPWPTVDVLSLKKIRALEVVFYHSDAIHSFGFGSLEWIYNNIVNRRTLNKMDVIIATSDNYFKTSKYLKFYKNKVKVIPLGIKHDGFYSVVQKDNVDINGLKSGGYALFIGALRSYKGIETICKASRFTKHKIVIAGGGKHLDFYKKKYEKYNVVFLGMVSEEQKFDLIRHCKVFLLPSITRAEAFGVVLLEASLQSRPMITTELGTGTTYVNKDGVTGLVVPPEEPEMLANAIDIFFLDRELCQKFSDNAFKRVKALFSIDDIAKQHIKLYKREIEKCRR